MQKSGTPFYIKSALLVKGFSYNIRATFKKLIQQQNAVYKSG